MQLTGRSRYEATRQAAKSLTSSRVLAGAKIMAWRARALVVAVLSSMAAVLNGRYAGVPAAVAVADILEQQLQQCFE